jgi:hypothetical protein
VATFNVRSGTLSTATQGAKDNPPVSKAAASHIDEGYYQYKFDQDFTTSSGATSARSQGRESNTAAVPMSRELAGNVRSVYDSAPVPRQMNGHAHLRASLERERERVAEENTLNYSVINNISRNSISMTEDPLNDSRESIAVIRHYQAQLQDRPSRAPPPNSADAAHRAENPPVPSRGGGAKTPNFMRQTASNAHKITTGKPHAYGHLGATH